MMKPTGKAPVPHRASRMRPRRAGDFDYSLDFATVNFRARPDLYRIGRGEQGVLSVEPYKAEILPHWRFKTPAEAQGSAEHIFAMYLSYKAAGDFVGMDMARKFLQMGHTRARRYANHPGGRKYHPQTGEELPPGNDAQKAESARIFKVKWDAVRGDEDYQRMRAAHRIQFESRDVEVLPEAPIR